MKEPTQNQTTTYYGGAPGGRMVSASTVWPWQVYRLYRRELRDLNIRHARERAAETTRRVECEHALKELLHAK